MSDLSSDQQTASVRWVRLVCKKYIYAVACSTKEEKASDLQSETTAMDIWTSRDSLP